MKRDQYGHSAGERRPAAPHLRGDVMTDHAPLTDEELADGTDPVSAAVQGEPTRPRPFAPAEGPTAEDAAIYARSVEIHLRKVEEGTHGGWMGLRRPGIVSCDHCLKEAVTDHAPLTDEEVSAMTEYWTSPTGVAQAPPGMVEYARLCVDRLTADLQATRAEVERLRDLIRTQASDAGPYMLLHWTDDIRHAEPCDCDLDNETAGEACMANSEWTYAVCVDGGAFAPRLILTLPRRPPEQPDHDGPPLIAIPFQP